MSKHPPFTSPFLGRRGRPLSTGTPGPVLSPARERELDQPTWMRRQLALDALLGPRRGQ